MSNVLPAGQAICFRVLFNLKYWDSERRVEQWFILIFFGLDISDTKIRNNLRYEI